MAKYPVMKTPVAVGKVLNVRNGLHKFEVVGSDGICWGDKGYTLKCECIQSDEPAMLGEIYHFDDRLFRDYNGNNVVIEDSHS